MEKIPSRIDSLQNEQKEKQVEILKYLKELEGSSFKYFNIKEISRLTGFSINKIYKS